MRITNHPSKPLIWWYNRRDTIDMDPTYQRKGRLWSTSDKAYLVDSVINGFDIPKLYVADFQLGDSKLNSKRLPYAIIDGKQRFEAIFDFFDGKLVLNDDFVYRLNPSLQLGGLSLKDLKKNYSKIAEIFETETVDVMSVITNNEEEINELFVRLNRSKPLTGAEIRNAMVGPVTDIIRNVARHSFFKDIIRFSTKRAADFNTAAKLLLIEYESRIVNTKKNDLDNFARNKKVDKVKLELAGRKLIDLIDDMQEIFLPRDELLSSAGPIPVYYWLVRSVSLRKQTIIREFLLDFERKRKENRQQQFHGKGEVGDLDLSRYDTLNRSVNDVSSLQGRFEILRDRLKAWRQ